MPLTYRTENHEYFLSLVKRFAFDNPKASTFQPEKSDFLVSGWCVPKNPNDRISLFVEYSGKPIEYFDLSINRSDVVNSLNLDVTDFFHKNFGFEIRVNPKHLKGIGFVINSVNPIELWNYTEVSQISGESRQHSNQLRLAKNDAIEAFPEEYLSIFSSQEEHIDDNGKFFNTILSIGEEYFSSVKINIVNIDNIDYLLDQKTNSLTRQIYEETTKNSWNTEAIARLCQNGSLFIFSDRAKTYSSFLVEDISYLLLSFENCFFYLIQYCGNIGIFYPKNQIFVSFTSINSWASLCASKLKKVFYLTLKKYVFSKNRFDECVFSGVILAQSRPYHYFYDGLYCLANLALDDSLEEPINVISIREKCFLDPSLIFPKSKFIFESQNIDSYNIRQCESTNEFHILSCNQYHLSKHNEIISHLDDKILNSVQHSRLNNSKLLESIFHKSNFVLWIGISSEKRKVDDLLKRIRILIQDLSKENDIRLTICFDGRTYPLQPSEQDRAFANSETKIIKDIQNDLPKNIVFFNLSGMNSIDKLFIAKNIDYFFCSFATDSLYVSRICKKQGFAYYPDNAEAALGMHIHPNAELIKCGAPNDSGGSPWHTTDSVIDWDLLSSKIKLYIFNKGVDLE